MSGWRPDEPFRGPSHPLDAAPRMFRTGIETSGQDPIDHREIRS